MASSDRATLATCFRAVTALLSASDRLKQRLGALVENEGITLQQYNVLRILRGAGPDGLPTMEIRDRMIERAPGITRLIDRLESKGLVERRPDERDRRAVACRITSMGKAVLKRLDGPVNRADRSAFEAFSERRLQALCRLLDELAPDEE